MGERGFELEFSLLRKSGNASKLHGISMLKMFNLVLSLGFKDSDFFSNRIYLFIKKS
jgi:hypothetical protein